MDKTRDQLIIEAELLDAECRRAQAVIEERERLYRLLVENSLGLMCTHDLDGVLLSINPAAAASLGYQPEDGIGRNLKEFLAPAVRHLFDAYLDRIRRNHLDSGLMRLVAKDGGERIWSYRNVLYEQPGMPPCVLGHALDITERIRAEQALKDLSDELARRIAERTAELERANEQLRASEARFRALSEYASDLVAVLGADAICRYVSPSHQRILGYRPRELTGENLFGLVHPDDLARMQAALIHTLAAAGPPAALPLEVRLRHADGSWRVLEIAMHSRLYDPAVCGIIVNARDITARKRVEGERAQLLQKEQEARALAEAAVRMRDEFLTAAAHDLRTPLAVVTAHLDLIRMDLESGQAIGPDWLDRRVAPAARAAARMLATVEDMTDAAFLQMGQPLPLHVGAVDVGEMVRTVVATLNDSAPRTGAPILVDAIDEVAVMGDRARLERVLHNVVGNAIKYSPRGSPIHVKVQVQGELAVVTVCDSGVGIPADELPHIFTHFYRASTAAGIPGMGIGLAGARAIVEQHGGRITVQSTVGRGTTVTISLSRRLPVNSHPATQQ